MMILSALTFFFSQLAMDLCVFCGGRSLDDEQQIVQLRQKSTKPVNEVSYYQE